MIVHILIYAFAALFIFMAMVIVFADQKTAQHGARLLAATYGASAVLALVFMQAWPLFAGLMLAFVFRMLGYDPMPHFQPPPKPGANPQAEPDMREPS